MEITWRRMPHGNKDIVVSFIDVQGLDLGIETTLEELEFDPIDPLDAFLEIKEETDEDEEDDEEDSVVESTAIVIDSEVYNLNKLFFRMGTYQKLTENPEDVWELLLRGTNRFFTTISHEDQRRFGLFFIDARQTIDRDLSNGGAITDVATTLGNILYDLAVETNLPDKLLHYVKYTSEIPIPDLSKAGTNASRDSDAMTFKLEEYYTLLAISVLCKMLSPIWGDMIDRTRDDVDNMMKEIQCINLIEPTLTLPAFNTVRNKLYHYVSTIVDKEMNSSYASAAFAATIGGVSRALFHHIVFCNLIVKRFVTIDLYITASDSPNGRDGNMMVWVATCSRQAYQSTQNALNKRCKILPRKDISEISDSGEDERSVSVLEHSSRITDVTADTPQLIRFGARMAVKKLCRKYDVSQLEFQQVLGYYQKNPVQVSIFNKILVGIFVGEHIGGCQGLKYLDQALYSELMTITQIYIAKNYAYPDVVHLMTAFTPSEERPVLELSSINSMIDSTAKKTLEYRGCEESFPYVLNNVGVGAALKSIQEFITKYHHHINTAPFISGIMDQVAPPTGSLLLYEPEVMQQCCSVILKNINPHELHTGGRPFVGV